MLAKHLTIFYSINMSSIQLLSINNQLNLHFIYPYITTVDCLSKLNKKIIYDSTNESLKIDLLNYEYFLRSFFVFSSPLYAFVEWLEMIFELKYRIVVRVDVFFFSFLFLKWDDQKTKSNWTIPTQKSDTQKCVSVCIEFQPKTKNHQF